MYKNYTRVGQNLSASVYRDESKTETIVLVPVNRTYTTSKKPVYYLKKGTGKEKPNYLTGLFATKDPTVFSGDIKNPITGMKHLLKVTFKDEGKALTIQGGSAW